MNLKNLCVLVGQQSGYTNFPCFLCLWDSRARQEHWTKENWPKTEGFEIGERNIIQFPLIYPNYVRHPPIHIKLGLMEQFSNRGMQWALKS